MARQSSETAHGESKSDCICVLIEPASIDDQSPFRYFRKKSARRRVRFMRLPRQAMFRVPGFVVSPELAEQPAIETIRKLLPK